MTHGSLFSGIGGFDLAAEWMGWENVFHCEWNEFSQKILKKHFPNAELFGDITQTDFQKYANKIDVISGGFPCQPFSTAGKRNGTEDDRYLWPEMLRAIREVRPRWIVGENVHGLVSWSKGVVLQQIKIDLENEGFEVAPPFILPACAVNAPHRRDRVWIIAHSMQRGLQKAIQRFGESLSIHSEPPNRFDGFVTEQWEITERNSGDIRNGDGIPNWMDRIGSLGNAIVPQVAYQIFKTIEQYELNNNDT